MNFKTTLFLLVLLIIVGGGFWLIERKAGPDFDDTAAPDTGTGTALFTADNFVTAAVTAISIEADDQTIELARSGADWHQTAPVQFPLQTWSTQQFGDDAAKLRHVEKFKPAGKDTPALADIGLSPPKAVVTFHFDDAGTTTTQTIKIGQRLPLGGRGFVMVNDDASGDVHAVFCHDYNRVFHIVSHDDGETFSAPEEITSVFDAFKADYDWAVVATGPAHGTQLRNGRMIFPLWMSDGSGSEFGPEHRGHRPSVVSMLYSDDHGTTWQAGEIVARHGENDIINPSETIMVELADGSVMFNMRSESKKRRRLTAVSPDGVSNWSAPTFDEALLEPVCMASLLRISWPEDGEGRILFANPNNLENDLIPPGGDLAHDRKRLTVKLSRDDGRSWPVSKVLEAGPSGYSDLAMLADNTVLCLYENELVEKMCDDKYLTLARFNMEWLLDAEKN